MLRILFFFSISIIITACTSETSISREQQVEDNPDIVDHSAPDVEDSSYNDNNTHSDGDFVPSSYSYKVIFEENNGWGYQIFEEDKMVINQSHIPAVQGIQGFSSQKNAEITAEYILKKIEEGNFPPTISVQTLDSLGVL